MAKTTEVNSDSIACKRCGVPVKYFAGDILVPCWCCGATTELLESGQTAEVDSQLVAAPAFKEEQVDKIIRTWVSGHVRCKPGHEIALDLVKTECISLPYWLVQVVVRTKWSGEVQRTIKADPDKGILEETVIEKTGGEDSEELNWVVYARENDGPLVPLRNFGASDYQSEPDWGKFVRRVGVDAVNAELGDFLDTELRIDPSHLAGCKRVSGQIRCHDAEHKATDEIHDYAIRHAKGKCDKLADATSEIELVNSMLLYLPLWLVEYQVKDKIYKAVVNGSTGAVEKAQAPAGAYEHSTFFALLFAVLAITSVAAAYFTQMPLLLIPAALSVIVVIALVAYAVHVGNQ